MELSARAGELIARKLRDRDPGSLEAIKAEVARELGLCGIPTNADVLASLPEADRERFRDVLRTKPVRSLSGVAVVAVMCEPSPCPHGTCSYCPRGEKAPQSYTGDEPAAMRAIDNGFDPFLQCKNRIEQLGRTGHPTEKVELIVMGGTFTATERTYQEWFVKRCLDALNGTDAADLDEALHLNEKATHRCVGITFETRPDWCRQSHVDSMLGMGVTRIELGVQTVFDDIYERVGRGHTVNDVVEATRTARDAGLKVNYHLMPGLPGSSRERDRQAFLEVFSDPRFRPDMVKIYPTLVIQGTRLYEEWRDGGYKPPDLDEMVSLIADVKETMPRWVRTMRIQRDIPAGNIVTGIREGNLGELVSRELARRGRSCQCIRCREIGRGKGGREYTEHRNCVLNVEEYLAGEGTELFLSVDDECNDVLLGYCRCRLPSGKAHRSEVEAQTAIIRELKVCGQAIPLGSHPEGSTQHHGIGSQLLRRSEELARERGKERMLVLSGIGVRPYFRRLGYRRNGPYMGRRL